MELTKENKLGLHLLVKDDEDWYNAFRVSKQNPINITSSSFQVLLIPNNQVHDHGVNWYEILYQFFLCL